jgi:hypothetical protein
MEIKTYAESKRRPIFDWNEFLNKEEMANDEWAHAEDLSSSWVTCACGNMCDVIPREKGGRPLDINLDVYGMNFSDAIENKDKEEAKRILVLIELRSQYLINNYYPNKEK